ncbi:MAG: hypothetical protein Q8M98_03950 [Candidatus Cloacimonadaceae bacterium]|nr:hypothetical protein [Candidatus Cloacimonadaceae bacterium]
MFKKLLALITNDEPTSKQHSDSDLSFFANQGMIIPKGCSKVLGGYGDFGSITNPVPVNGIVGEFMYLNRLRSKLNGTGFLFHRLGSFESIVTKTPIDIYEMVTIDGSEWHQICLCPYYPKRSLCTPSYARLYPWNQMSEALRVMSKFGFGVNSIVSEFPLGLPEAMRESNIHKALGTSMVNTLVRKVEEILIRNSGVYDQTRELYLETDKNYLLNAIMNGGLNSMSMGGNQFNITVED